MCTCLLRPTLTYLREMIIMSNAMPDKHRGREISNVRKILGANHMRGNVPTESHQHSKTNRAWLPTLRKLLSHPQRAARTAYKTPVAVFYTLSRELSSWESSQPNVFS
jgi:hypothetical protein